MSILLGVLFFLPGRAWAQLPSQSPGEPISQESFEDAGRKRSPDEGPAPVAQALDLAFGATVWASVHISTMGAVYDLSELSAQGFYERELIELVLIAAKSGQTLKTVCLKRLKGTHLSKIADDAHLSYAKIYDAAEAIQKAVDRDYRPRFPERKTVREDSSP
jgi:hypothetical protein